MLTYTRLVSKGNPMRKIEFDFKKVIIGACVGLIAASTLVLSAFAFNDDESGDTARVVEEMKADGSYILAEAAELDDIASTSDTGSEDTTDAESPVRNVELLGASKDYLSDMSEEEIQSLSSEALTEAGLDSSLADGDLVTSGITFEVPEGFEASPDVPGLYVPKRYPIDASNLVYNELDADYTLQMMDEGYFEELVEQGFASRYGSPIDVTITEYQHIKIDDVPAIRLMTEYDIEGNHVTSLMIIINGSKTYTLTYTMTHDYDRMELFEASVASIHLNR